MKAKEEKMESEKTKLPTEQTEMKHEADGEKKVSKRSDSVVGAVAAGIGVAGSIAASAYADANANTTPVEMGLSAEEASLPISQEAETTLTNADSTPLASIEMTESPENVAEEITEIVNPDSVTEEEVLTIATDEDSVAEEELVEDDSNEIELEVHEEEVAIEDNDNVEEDIVAITEPEVSVGDGEDIVPDIEAFSGSELADRITTIDLDIAQAEPHVLRGEEIELLDIPEGTLDIPMEKVGEDIADVDDVDNAGGLIDMGEDIVVITEPEVSVEDGADIIPDVEAFSGSELADRITTVDLDIAQADPHLLRGEDIELLDIPEATLDIPVENVGEDIADVGDDIDNVEDLIDMNEDTDAALFAANGRVVFTEGENDYNGVNITTPNGEQFTLVDKDGDGVYESIYDTDGNFCEYAEGGITDSDVDEMMHELADNSLADDLTDDLAISDELIYSDENDLDLADNEHDTGTEMDYLA